jgi:hypothetical protein
MMPLCSSSLGELLWILVQHPSMSQKLFSKISNLILIVTLNDSKYSIQNDKDQD